MTYAHAIADLDGSDLVADLDGLADDLVADTDGQGSLAPAAVDGVHIAATDTACLDLDVDISVFEFLWLELHNRIVVSNCIIARTGG